MKTIESKVMLPIARSVSNYIQDIRSSRRRYLTASGKAGEYWPLARLGAQTVKCRHGANVANDDFAVLAWCRSTERGRGAHIALIDKGSDKALVIPIRIGPNALLNEKLIAACLNFAGGLAA